MAGGPNAQFMACLECVQKRVLTRAERVHEGVESDQYVCDEGHRFGVTFPKGPPKQPDWPPPQDLVDYCTKPGN